MGFSRYAIEKKQVSTDRGVTWQDVTPSETREGTLVGTYRTLIECEDAACDLEKTEYTVIDGFLPTELCGDTFRVLPSGIAKMVSWTSGAICCAEWQSASPHTTDKYETVISHSIGKPRCIKDGSTTYCPSFEYSTTYVNGRELDNLCFNVQPAYQWVCPETLCACFQITEFMPWVEGKTSWKLIQAQHYVREHCSEPWETDGEPYIVGIAERWKFVDETFEQERWVHQVAKTFDDNGNVVEWQSDSTFDYRYMTETELDPSIELLDYVINDGILKSNERVAADSEGSVIIRISLDENSTSFGGTIYSMAAGDYGASYVATTRDWEGDVIPPSIFAHTHWAEGHYHYSEGVLTNSFKTYFLAGSPNTKKPYSFSWFDGLIGTKTGKLLNQYGDTVAFPCRIYEDYGQSDDYLNSSKIGYVVRDGDGTMIVMETLKLVDGQIVKE